ncbi:dihydrofolate reductase [Mycoplasma corogypsi]|uniref:dihydrofolate reductase n=1 Tax=Mycoplasma corogypsi TaxID=2106 RepID=UPI003873C153
MIKLIVAVDPNNLIGNGNVMPWNIKQEFKHFRETTLNQALLFGRNTFLGLPKKLDNRINYVLSTDEVESADQVIHNETELFELFDKYKHNTEKTLFISGGKSIYEKYYTYADELIISRLKKAYEGNVYLNLDLSQYQLTKVEEFEEFNVEYYVKKQLTKQKTNQAISWDDYFMGLAKLSACRSKDPSTQVGACIIDQHKHVIGLGYNGMPKGNDESYPWVAQAESGSVKDTKYPYVMHAEVNAILNTNTSIRDTYATLYTSLFPCSNCAKIIVQSGIKEIVYENNKYQHTEDAAISRYILEVSNIKVRQHDSQISFSINRK